MKRFIILLLFVVAALVSCSKDKSLSTNETNSIEFRSAIGTRAAVATTANLTEFMVAAFDGANELFAPTRFIKGEGSTSFVSVPAQYWPDNDNTISFYAYAPTTNNEFAHIGVEKKSLLYSTNSFHGDLIVAKAEGSRSANAAGVELNFKHILSQIEVQAKSTSTYYNFKVAQIKICNSLTCADYDFDTDSWSDQRYQIGLATNPYSEDFFLDAEYRSIMGSDQNLMMIPQQLVPWDTESDPTNTAKGAYIAVNLRITTADPPTYVFPAGEPHKFAWACIPIDTNWEPGKKYIYQLDFSEGAGKFSPDDPTNPGKDILPKMIKFHTQVVPWDELEIAWP